MVGFGERGVVKAGGEGSGGPGGRGKVGEGWWGWGGGLHTTPSARVLKSC